MRTVRVTSVTSWSLNMTLTSIFLGSRMVPVNTRPHSPHWNVPLTLDLPILAFSILCSVTSAQSGH